MNRVLFVILKGGGGGKCGLIFPFTKTAIK